MGSIVAAVSILQRVEYCCRSLREVDHHIPLGRALRDHLDSGLGRLLGVSRRVGILYMQLRRRIFSYAGYRGKNSRGLYLDETLLGEVAHRLGWNWELLGRTPESEYLAHLGPRLA
jgi:hypothetical protein